VPTPSTLARARTAVFVVFALPGLALATWASRLPESRQAMGLTTSQLGLLLLVGAAGSVASLPLAGGVAARLGTVRAVHAGASLTLSGLLWTGVAAAALHSPLLAAVGLVAMGIGNGMWDVAMNLEGAEVERRLGRATMPAFHASFSLGTVVGAGIGALAAALGVPVAVHLGVIAAVSLGAVLQATRGFLPDALAAHDGHAPEAGQEHRPRARAGSAWAEPRTLLVGVLVLSAAFTEGTANDWMGIAFVDGYGTGPAVGALGLAAFLAAMTAARLAGQRALDRWGRVPVLRVTMALGAAGALLVVFGGSAPAAAAGAVLWGAGASLGFPVGISAAADDPARAAARVSVVTTIGYTAFLAGPPLLGALGSRFGVLNALLVVSIVLVPSALAVPAARKPAGT
jgi:MFS family permease